MGWINCYKTWSCLAQYLWDLNPKRPDWVRTSGQDSRHSREGGNPVPDSKLSTMSPPNWIPAFAGMTAACWENILPFHISNRPLASVKCAQAAIKIIVTLQPGTLWRSGRLAPWRCAFVGFIQLHVDKSQSDQDIFRHDFLRWIERQSIE